MKKSVITEEDLRNYLPDRYKDLPLYIFDSLDSTNSYARNLAENITFDASVVIAHKQTGGRGRLGRSFASLHQGIYMTVLIKPRFDLTENVLITSAAAVAVAESIDEICHKESKIKWVNDIFVDGKKVCGILAEGIVDSKTCQISYIAIGIGINTSLNGFPDELLQVAGALEGDYPNSALAASVISKLLDMAKNLDHRRFMRVYREKSIVIGNSITVYKDGFFNRPNEQRNGLSARVLDIDNNGGLCVIYTDGSRETLSSGEISIRLQE